MHTADFICLRRVNPALAPKAKSAEAAKAKIIAAAAIGTLTERQIAAAAINLASLALPVELVAIAQRVADAAGCRLGSARSYANDCGGHLYWALERVTVALLCDANSEAPERRYTDCERLRLWRLAFPATVAAFNACRTCIETNTDTDDDVSLHLNAALSEWEMPAAPATVAPAPREWEAEWRIDGFLIVAALHLLRIGCHDYHGTDNTDGDVLVAAIADVMDHCESALRRRAAILAWLRDPRTLATIRGIA